MTDSDQHRRVSLTRTGPSSYVATNVRGGTIEIGAGEGDAFTPVELLLAAMAGCSSVDVDLITGKRAEPTGFDVVVEADKVRDEQGNHLGPVTVTFTVTFPEGEAGDAARAVLPKAIEMSRDRLCTVSRTVALPTEVTMRET